ncbi:NAD(P)H-dependent oxidoreductase [Flectobacillus major]|uniref:NAD(P)H-dependent oxidoreductase n=1 Tax=Flectobacillus major TaxID=103 RepID=UPI000405B603|nr:NAD(P)H-dependent oxidoreductase [Flectobacillus major]
MAFIEQLNWRYATKRMSGEVVPPEKLATILEAIRLSASSMGLQPYTIFVIEDPEVRKQIHPVAYNQPQVLESSHLLVFTAWENVTEENVDTYLNQIATERGISIESLAGFKANFGGILSRSAEDNFNWAARQAYIALGTGIAAAAIEKVDASPMEGFNPAAVDEILGLKEKGLRSVALLALGYRDNTNDPLVKAKKIRRSAEQLFVKI